MAINSYFFNAVLNDGVYDRVYNADDMTSYLDLLVGNGVFPNPSTQLQVRAGTGMNVIVGAGSGWINGHKMVNTADYAYTLRTSADIVEMATDVNQRLKEAMFSDDALREYFEKLVNASSAQSE